MQAEMYVKRKNFDIKPLISYKPLRDLIRCKKYGASKYDSKETSV